MEHSLFQRCSRGRALVWTFFQKIIIIILRLNYSHNYVLVASALKQRQSYNSDNVNRSKWMLIAVMCCHWWAITHFLTSVKWVTWNTQATVTHFFSPPPHSDMMPTNHFSPKQITVKGLLSSEQIHLQWSRCLTQRRCQAISAMANFNHANQFWFILCIHAVKSQ